jgi:hypothetical protein
MTLRLRPKVIVPLDLRISRFRLSQVHMYVGSLPGEPSTLKATLIIGGAEFS